MPMKGHKFTKANIIILYGVFAFLSTIGLAYAAASLFPEYQLPALVVWVVVLSFIPAGIKSWTSR